ncbi:MAG: hypothetical protein MR902_07515 [Campylobacter sp.]|nr:hypothetical protein [Campylobacter sp.]
MFYAIIAAVTAIAMVAVYLLMPVPPEMENAKAKGLDEFNVPTNSNSRVVPELFGTCELKGNIIWFGDLRSKEIKK